MRYDEQGLTYSLTRRPDPRIAAAIDAALACTDSVANIGAGAGSYEPNHTVVAIEPSDVMIAQRTSGAAPALRAIAERLPLQNDSVDAALAVLTVHHWQNLERGIAELMRVARRRVVILGWDHRITREFWLLRDYLPSAAETDGRLAVPITRLVELLGGATVQEVPVPHDCSDGFGGAYWRRPRAYLDPLVQAGMSMLALTSRPELETGLSRLRADIASGGWERRYADLLELDSLDLGYRLVIADL
ncbi:class I SAM-dependent methyltransferase [Prescottella soli]|uniref:Class I SAM-dependent methyltransferase n=1 Tax=Prescottella soli TaxID=1543852 RepID=A0ABW9FQL1_9NOCA